MKRRALLLTALALAPAFAQTSRKQSAPIYRCGPGGRQLSDRPCEPDAAGSAVRFDSPSDGDSEAARQRAAREAKEAARLQQERERLERQPAPAPQRLSAPPAESASPKPEPPRKAGTAKSKKPAKRSAQGKRQASP